MSIVFVSSTPRPQADATGFSSLRLPIILAGDEAIQEGRSVARDDICISLHFVSVKEVVECSALGNRQLLHHRVRAVLIHETLPGFSVDRGIDARENTSYQASTQQSKDTQPQRTMKAALILCASAWLLVDARELCSGEECTSSMQCDRYSACYATSSKAITGKCYTRRGVTTQPRRTGQSCKHAGDCDSCSYCFQTSAGRPGTCQLLKEDEAPPTGDHLQLESLQRRLKQEFSALARSEDDRRKLTERVKEDQSALHRARHSSLLQTITLRFVVIVVASFVVVLVAIVVHRFYPRRVVRAPSGPPATAPPAEAPELSSSDDDEVSEGEEAALLGEHAPTSPTATVDLDPEDPNTCKICYDSVINCVLLDCGHMCVCMGCAKRLRNCPMCRNVIRKRKRIFKS
eukprot:TRINITY_DN5611_c0_g1_i10.p1 TRINITY_DN5611_c0_g1~~TRINITY_DN5611_c0_g1_i10.p1  ORF type:complete len:403 (+),score=44.53 TRINITY_DN5611_c0_g1_i10:541-1749(+)